MSTPLYAWAQRWHIPYAALEDLRAITGVKMPEAAHDTGHAEAAVQSRVRLRAPYCGYYLWRNNSGALLDSRGVPVRYGLANDSPQMNQVLKSSDLIGWKRTLVTQEMVGTHVAIMTTLECKPEGWRYSGTAREKAQAAWIDSVVAEGGIGRFISHEEQLP